MPKPLQKSLQDYLSEFKKPPTPHIHLPSKPLSSSTTSWILRGCNHPKTLSFASDRSQNEHRLDVDIASTLSDEGRFSFGKIFKSPYQNDDHEEKSGGFLFDSPGKRLAHCTSPFSPEFIHPPPDLCGSHRFFVDPGSSSSLIKEARKSTTVSEDTGSSSTTAATTTLDDSTRYSDDKVKEVMSADDYIAVSTNSSSPYDDLRYSMKEMVEARLHQHGKVDWEFMEELLFCYLNLNDKKSYKYILSAFVDLVIVLRENSGKPPAKSRHFQSTGWKEKVKK